MGYLLLRHRIWQPVVTKSELALDNNNDSLAEKG